MPYIASITSQGQVTIPKKVQQSVGIRPPQKVSLTIRGKKVILEPESDIDELYGCLNKYAKKGKSIDRIIKEEHEAFEQAIVDSR